MPKILLYLLTILCLTVTINTHGQSNSSPDFSTMSSAKLDSSKILSQKIENQYALFIDSASQALCAQDTNLAIVFLKKYVESPTKNMYAQIYAYKIGILYLKMNQAEAAKKAFLYFLTMERRADYYDYSNFLACNKLLWADNVIEGGFKYNACLRLSEMASVRQDFWEALTYLTWAAQKYPADYRGCANGYYLYKGQLNRKFADVYLSRKDTVKAVGYLLSILLDGEARPNKEVPLLKELLHKKYTKKQIILGINKGIASVRKVNIHGEYGIQSTLEMTIFGQEVHWLMRHSDDIEGIKSDLKNDRYLRQLKE